LVILGRDRRYAGFRVSLDFDGAGEGSSLVTLPAMPEYRTLDRRDFPSGQQLTSHLAALERQGWERAGTAGYRGDETIMMLLRRDVTGDEAEEAGIRRIAALFAERRRGLRLAREEDGTWTALVVPNSIPEKSTALPEASGATALAAAEATWAEYGADFRTEHLTRGNVDVWRRDDGVWAVRWCPDQGEPGYPGHTYMPGELGTPDDFPTSNEPDALLAWARNHFGVSVSE
jgi:hypothetical protein